MPIPFEEAFNELNSTEKAVWRGWIEHIKKPDIWSIGILVCFLCINNARLKAIRGAEDFYILLKILVKETPEKEMEATSTGYLADERNANPLFYSLCCGRDEDTVLIVMEKTPKNGFNNDIQYTSPYNLCVYSLLHAAIFSKLASQSIISKILAKTNRIEVIENAFKLLTESENDAHGLSAENKGIVLKAIKSRIRKLKILRRMPSLQDLQYAIPAILSPKARRSSSAPAAPLEARLLPEGSAEDYSCQAK